MRVTILAHEQFPDRAKTAQGILRYADYDVVAVLDRDRAGERVADHVPDAQDAPIVTGMDDVDEPVDALIVGIAPIGGGFDESWRPDVRTALERGCDVVSGLHYFLTEDEEFAALAAAHDAELWDVREPPEDLSVSEGVAADIDAEIVCTVGTDCSVGKMTATMELVDAAREAGHDAAVIPTGQTGIMVEGWGNPIDRVISDFTAGAVEEMILEKGDEHDLLVVEGQGSIVHPAYSAVTCGILHGAMADRLVMCHDATRESIHGYESFDLPPIETYVSLYESLAAPVRESEVVAGMLDTHHLEGDDAARAALSDFEDAVGAPATDPIRYDAAEVLEAIV
ncbi:DUF1611 domain-containing protein [Halovivax limisalsi]|uniref:DUF1611 domain-containing protein n=1 Tax=Halovivax limisalsi TaxID=1453760 RepID=UPI001FFD6E9B|nr:DUF1611 domain-containing protein [Halovivax limisalsi]